MLNSQMVLLVFLVLLYVPFNASGDAADPASLEVGSCVGPETVQDSALLVSQYTMSGQAWEGLSEALEEEGCHADALLAAEAALRLFRTCACSDSEEAKAASSAASSRFALLLANFPSRPPQPSCCGASAVIEQGGSAPVLVGGAFRAGSPLQHAWAELSLSCPRYFGQCVQTNPFQAQQQDVYLHHILGDLRGGFFVDIGSVDGFSFSNTLFFEQALNWTGLCFEPNSHSFGTLQRVRSGCEAFNNALSDAVGAKDFLQCSGYTRMLSGLVSSLSQEQQDRVEAEMRVHGGSHQVVTVEVTTLADVFKARGVTHVDLISLDTEGAELEVLRGIDWSVVTISVIIVEMLDTDSPDAKAIDTLLRQQGFKQEGYVCQDMVYRHASFERSRSNARKCSGIATADTDAEPWPEA